MKHVLLRMRHTTLVLALACVAVVPREARAQQGGIDEGRSRFTRGIDLYKEGNFHAALAEFRAAYVAAPSFRIHYNLGQTLYQLQDYAGAVRAFDQYLAEGADKIDADRRKEVEGELAKLRPRVAELRFVVNVPGAEVSIDDEPRGKALKQAVFVSEGRCRISVTASGYQTETRVLDVAGAQRLELNFELKPIVGMVAPKVEIRSESPEPPRSRPKSRTAFYVGLVSTGVLGGGTAAMAILASSKHSAYEKTLGVPQNAERIAEARTATRTTALVADVLGGATALAAGLTLIAFAVTSGEEPVTKASASPPKLVWRPVVGPSAVGLVGTF